METVKVEMVAMLLARFKASGGDVPRTKPRSLLASSSVAMESSSLSTERSVTTVTRKVETDVLHTASSTRAGSVKERKALLRTARESVETESSISVETRSATLESGRRRVSPTDAPDSARSLRDGIATRRRESQSASESLTLAVMVSLTRLLARSAMTATRRAETAVPEAAKSRRTGLASKMMMRNQSVPRSSLTVPMESSRSTSEKNVTMEVTLKERTDAPTPVRSERAGAVRKTMTANQSAQRSLLAVEMASWRRTSEKSAMMETESEETDAGETVRSRRDGPVKKMMKANLTAGKLLWSAEMARETQRPKNVTMVTESTETDATEDAKSREDGSARLRMENLPYAQKSL